MSEYCVNSYWLDGYAVGDKLMLAAAPAIVTTATVQPNSPPLYLYCVYHSAMGMATNQATPTTTNYAVTVQNVGGANKYFINGVQQAVVSLKPGSTFTFDQSHSSNNGHPLRLSITSNGIHASGGSEYTTGVTYNGVPGYAGAYTRVFVAASVDTIKDLAAAKSITSSASSAAIGVYNASATKALTMTVTPSALRFTGSSVDPINISTNVSLTFYSTTLFHSAGSAASSATAAAAYTLPCAATLAATSIMQSNATYKWVNQAETSEIWTVL